MASKQASGAAKRDADGDVATPNREARKEVKVEKNMAEDKADSQSQAAMRQGTGLFQTCGGAPCWVACLNIFFPFFVFDRRGRGGGRVRDGRWGE